ncbi:MAG: hypothetical protein SOV55_07070 [Candidatus Borkfalkiaceae bacterium]|nr:hypothetical protein [Christensenellaceae bacterium]
MQVPVKEVGLQPENAVRGQDAGQTIDKPSQEEKPLLNISAQGSPASGQGEQTVNRSNTGVRKALNLSLVGLILSIFCGVGLVFSIIGTVLGATHSKYDKTASKYSVGMGIAGIILSSIFIVLTVAVIVVLVLNSPAPLA